MRNGTACLPRTVLLFLLLTAVLVYPVVALEAVTEILADGPYDFRESAEIRAVFESAEARGVPHELLVPRLQEGIAKHVSAARLSQALERDVELLDSVRRLARSIAGGDHLIEETARWLRAATVLQAGYSESELRQLLEATAERPDRFRPATALYISLRDWGLESPEAVRIVAAAVQSPLPAGEYPGIAEILALARRERVRPADMVDRIVVALPRARSVGDLRNRVIE